MENKKHRPEGEIVVYQPDERFSDIIHVESLILNIRDRHVILDKDLALLYGVTTKRLNEQVKRNIERFPESFKFQLKKIEMEQLVANCDRFAPLKHSTSRHLHLLNKVWQCYLPSCIVRRPSMSA